MAAAVTRDLSIVYGGFTVGATSDYHIDELFQLDKNYDTFRMECVVTIISASGTTEAQFATACTNLEDAFRKPDQKLTVANGGSTWFEADPASSVNSGFLQRSRIVKTGDSDGPDSARSRKYRITVEGQLPADLSGRSGRRNASVRVTDNASNKRRITISGTYTAVGSSGAKAVYEANIATFASSVLSTWGGTYNLTDKSADPQDDQDKILSFSRTYEMILLDEAVGTLNHAAITRQVMAVTIRDLGPDDSPVSFAVLAEVGSPFVTQGSPLRPVRIEVAASISVDKDQETDLAGLFDNTIKPWMIAHAQNVAGQNFSAIEEISRTPSYSENTISAKVTALAAAGGILNHALTVELTDRTGIGHLGVFGENPLWKHKIQNERTVLRLVTQVVTLPKGGASSGGAGSLGGVGAPAFAPGGTGGLGAWVAPGNAGNGIGSSVTGSPGRGASAQNETAGSTGVGAGAAGVPEEIPYRAEVLADVGLTPPDVEGEAYWDRLETRQQVKPGKIGITGYEFEVDRLVTIAVDALRVVPPTYGGQ